MELGILERLNINKAKDMYTVIKSIKRKGLKITKNDFRPIFDKYQINETRMSQFMAVYIESWYEEK